MEEVMNLSVNGDTGEVGGRRNKNGNYVNIVVIYKIHNKFKLKEE